MTEGSFSAKKQGESRYEETIPDRPTTSGATVPPVGTRRESQYPDDLSHGRGRETSARRSRPSAARGGIGVDEPGHGGGSSAPGRRASPAAFGGRAHRWGKEDGYCVVDGQKVPIRRTVCAARNIANNGWAVTSCSSAVRRGSTRCGTR